MKFMSYSVILYALENLCFMWSNVVDQHPSVKLW